MKTPTAAALVLVLLAGCALERREPRDPVFTKEMRLAAAGARECVPIVAERRMADDWKYGCFCGRGHPDMTQKVPNSGEPLTQEERNKLAVEYFSIKPIDDIDAACQSHDVCWVLTGDGDLDCNKKFEDRLEELRDGFNARRKWGDTKSVEYRCAGMANDMVMASLIYMEVDPATGKPGTSQGRGIFRMLIGIPGSLIYGALRWLTWKFGGDYPSARDRCLL